MGWRSKAIPVEDDWRSKAISLGPTEQNVMPELWDENTPAPEPWQGSSITADFIKGTGEDILGGFDLAKTIITAASGEIAGGAIAGFGMALFNQHPDSAAETVKAVSEFMTVDPWSERGKEMLETIAAPLMRLEQGVSDFSYKLSIDEKTGEANPFVAALIKGTLLGTPEIFLPTKGAFKAGKAARLIQQRTKEFQNVADDLGIRLEMDHLGADIVDAARSMTPKERGQNMPLLEQAIKEAEAIAYNKKNAAYEAAKQTDTWIETRSVRALGRSLEKRLYDEGFDLDATEMGGVRKILDDFSSTELGFAGESLSVRLNQFDLLYKRVGKKFGRDLTANKALTKIKRAMNDFLDDEFIAIAKDQGSAISGDTTGVKAWKDARAANTIWKENFHTDKFIKKLINEEATAETFMDALMGGSVMGAKNEMATVVYRLKEVLGDNHPAIEGLRQDFLFKVAEPLTKETPNFAMFVRQWDHMIRNKPSLVKALGLKESNLRPIYEFSKLQTRLPKKLRLDRKDMTKGMSQFFVGHRIAKAALRVNISRNIANWIIGTDRVGAQQMLADMAGVKYGEVLIPKYTPIAAEFIAGAALTGIPNTQD
jgi:hypothetical protein